MKKKSNKNNTQKSEKINPSEVVVEGVVIDARANAMFEVKLDNDQSVLCTICGKIRTKHIRILPGDRVRIGVNIYDMTKGRILFRL